MKVQPYKYPGWNDHPTYIVPTYQDYKEICEWMRAANVGSFLLSSGSTGYVFQVKSNHEWFMLRWG